MMYELRINIFCEHESDFEDVLDKLDDLKPHMRVVNPSQPDQECSAIDVITNRHDENPHEPCTLLEHWDNCPLVS